MKIIRKGILPEAQVHRVSCEYCKTLFEFEEQEAQYISDQRDGDYFEIDCPFCSNPVTLNAALRDSEKV